jgi:flavin-dependent dehydrogenase
MTASENELKVAIIGGGPAGSFTCHFLDKFAREAGKKISVDIYDFRCFTCAGRKSCNMCAGIISSTLVAKLEQENIFLPKSVIKRDISGYQLHSAYNTVYLRRRGVKKIYSVFRGQGPQQLGGEIDSFDQFLLDFVQRESNARLINKRVTGLDFSNSDCVTLKAEGGTQAVYDVVIGAFGVNTRIKDLVGNGYKPPESIKFLQFETDYPPDFIERTYKDRVHMFPVYRKNIWSITLTPKQRFVTVTAAGKNVRLEDVKKEIMNNKNIRHYLPGKNFNMKCSCKPALPIGLAKKPYTNRFLVVGDACVSRYLKNGIESAFQTAYLAADTIIHHGLSEKILKKHYYERCKKEYRLENRCGKFLYLMDRFLFLNPLYAEAHIIMAKKEQITGTGASTRFSDVLWDMFTGDKPYTTVLKNSFHPRLIYTTFKELSRLLFLGIFRGKSAFHYPVSKFYKLLNTHKVAIIGGGPAGSAFAIKLARLAKEKNLAIDIYLFEGKDFKRHHNQCVGILSPPLTEILTKDLGLTLPEGMIRSEVPGYELHTEHEAIFLENYHATSPASRTYSVRRKEFDQFLLDKAAENGVHVISSRVTDIEFCRDIYHDEVRIFSESDYLVANAVVCAFGLDNEMQDKLTRATHGKYKRPKKIMKTFVTRLDFSKKLLDKTYDKRIYPFLIASLKNVRFGAVTVKDEHIVVNVAGEKITSLNLKEFLGLRKVNEILPDEMVQDIKYYSGQFPSSPARKPYGDRYVAVGDATGWLRPLKGKGINLAVITAVHAATVMVNEGFSKKHFEKYKELCKEFRQDYKYGMLVSLTLKFLIRSGILNVMMRKAKKNSRLHNILYDAVSAEKSYKQIMKDFFSIGHRSKIKKSKAIETQKHQV